MLARHLPLLWTFAGGCLSGAALIALWPGDTETVSSPSKRGIARNSEAVAPATATTTPPTEATSDAPKRALPGDAPNARDDAPDTHAEPGSSVADVLASLEAAYRQGLSDAAAAHAPPSAAREPTISPRAEAPATEVAASVPVNTEKTATIATTAPAPTSPPEINAVAHPVGAPEAGPVLAARDEPLPSNVNVHVGDNNQSTHVGDVYQGNVVLIQQPALYGYPQVFAPPPPARGASVAYTSRGVSSQFTTRGVTSQRMPTFASSWTVPNDRLGYDSALVPMLK